MTNATHPRSPWHGHAACHIHQQDWGVPIIIDPDGERVVRLVLSGA